MTFTIDFISKYRASLMSIAIIWVILFHAQLHTNIALLDYIFEIGYGGVDIFLFLSGFGLYYSCSKQKEVDIKTFYVKRFKRIFPVFWASLFIMYIIQGEFTAKSFLVLLAKCYTLGLWLPFIPMYLWYVSFICMLYIIYPLLFNLYLKKPKATLIITILICILPLAIYIYNNMNDTNNGMLILALARLPIFFIGSIFGAYTKTRNKVQQKILNPILLSLMIFGFISLWYFKKHYDIYLWNGGLSFLPFIVIIPGLCVVLSSIIASLPNKCKNSLNYIGKYTFEIYVLNEFLLATLSCPSTYLSDNTWKLIILLINIVLGILLHKLVNKFVNI